MLFPSSAILLAVCSILALTSAEMLPRHIDLNRRQESSPNTASAAMSSSTSSTDATQTGTSGGQGGLTGGGSNVGEGVNGAAGTQGAAALPTSPSAGVAGARATGDVRVWAAAGMGAGLVGVVGAMV